MPLIVVFQLGKQRGFEVGQQPTNLVAGLHVGHGHLALQLLAAEVDPVLHLQFLSPRHRRTQRATAFFAHILHPLLVCQ